VTVSGPLPPPPDSLLERIRENLGTSLSTDFVHGALHWLAQEIADAGYPLEFSWERFIKLYHCWPGMGKTEKVTRLAEQPNSEYPFADLSLPEQDKLYPLVLGLTHKSFDNVTRAAGWGMTA